MITASVYSSYFCVWFLCSNRPQALFAMTYLSLWFLFYLTVIVMMSSTLHPVFWSMCWYLLVVAQVPSMSIHDCVCPSVFPWLIFNVFPVGLFTYIMPVSNFSFLLYFEGSFPWFPVLFLLAVSLPGLSSPVCDYSRLCLITLPLGITSNQPSACNSPVFSLLFVTVFVHSVSSLFPALRYSSLLFGLLFIHLLDFVILDFLL